MSGVSVPVTDVEIVADRTEESRCDDGFLRLRRLRVRNVHADGTRSREYACDVVSRAHVDAVVVALYEVDTERRVWVVLKDGLRPPVYLRKDKDLAHPDPREYLTVTELAAGVLEEGDEDDAGIAARAAAEAWEECGLRVLPEVVTRLGDALFPSPGVSDEKVHFRAAPVTSAGAHPPAGDGSVMEEGTRIVVLELHDAITRCREGTIPDMKTEIGLLRLAEALGYLPQLGMFVDELPEDVRARFRRLGLEAEAE